MASTSNPDNMRSVIWGLLIVTLILFLAPYLGVRLLDWTDRGTAKQEITRSELEVSARESQSLTNSRLDQRNGEIRGRTGFQNKQAAELLGVDDEGQEAAGSDTNTGSAVKLEEIEALLKSDGQNK